MAPSVEVNAPLLRQLSILPMPVLDLVSTSPQELCNALPYYDCELCSYVFYLGDKCLILVDSGDFYITILTVQFSKNTNNFANYEARNTSI